MVTMSQMMNVLEHTGEILQAMDQGRTKTDAAAYLGLARNATKLLAMGLQFYPQETKDLAFRIPALREIAEGFSVAQSILKKELRTAVMRQGLDAAKTCEPLGDSAEAVQVIRMAKRRSNS